MRSLRITVGSYRFVARQEEEAAPQICAAFCKPLPFRNRVIHSRWSGEAVWVPLGEFATGVGFENHTSHPSRGDILLYPGRFSETEILFAYGSACFASKMGMLAANHFLTVVEGAQPTGCDGQAGAVGRRPRHRVRGCLAREDNRMRMG